MPMVKAKSPLSLYVHMPWCVKKCPYCDFNSHELKSSLAEDSYINALIADFNFHLPEMQEYSLQSIFFGGGTPSLFSAKAIEKLLHHIHNNIHMQPDIEITLEANPGTIDNKNFSGYKTAGINRLSIGVQSFNDEKLKSLGRIHDSKSAIKALKLAKKIGFHNINLDLMYGLPHQTLNEALLDIEVGIKQETTHLSWYQLTIEPNTLFFHQPPSTPQDDELWDIQIAGQTLLAENNFKQYEVSAYAKQHFTCRHNLNYWQFGDYLGIGAGAHSKLTCSDPYNIIRFVKIKHPRDYMLAENKIINNEKTTLNEQDKIFEFMLNALRLTDDLPLKLFTEKTNLSVETIQPILDRARRKGFLNNTDDSLRLTHLGQKFLNDVIGMFLP